MDAATFPVVLKEGLKAAGVEVGWCLAPARDLSDDQRTELTHVVAELAARSRSAR